LKFIKSGWFAVIIITLLVIISLLVLSPFIPIEYVNKASSFQSIATIVALCFGAYWFIIRRRAVVRLEVTQDIVKVVFSDLEFLYVRVVITVSNKGEVVYRPGNGFTRIQQIRPLPQEIRDKLSKAHLYDAAKRTTIEWPAFEQDDGALFRNLNVSSGLKSVEPGLTEQIYVDFFLPKEAEIIEVTSHVENIKSELGWIRKSIHDLTKEEK